MSRHAWSLNSTQGVMTLGLTYRPVISPLNDYEAAANTGCLTNVLNKYRKVFGDLNEDEAAAINAGCLT